MKKTLKDKNITTDYDTSKSKRKMVIIDKENNHS